MRPPIPHSFSMPVRPSECPRLPLQRPVVWSSRRRAIKNAARSAQKNPIIASPGRVRAVEPINDTIFGRTACVPRKRLHCPEIEQLEEDEAPTVLVSRGSAIGLSRLRLIATGRPVKASTDDELSVRTCLPEGCVCTGGSPDLSPAAMSARDGTDADAILQTT